MRLAAFLLILALWPEAPSFATEPLQAVEEALAFQKAAIARYEQVGRKAVAPAKDAANLSRLIEAINKGIALEYQAVNLRNAKRGAAAPEALQEFLSLQRKMVRSTSELIGKFPKDADASTALLFRARAHKELGDIAKAIADLKRLLAEYPKSGEVPIAAFTLSDLLISAKDYRGAIAVLNDKFKELEPGLQSLAWDRIAWSEYHLGELDQALVHLGNEMTLLKDRPAELKTAFETAALIFATGAAQGKNGFTAAEAIRYFETYGTPEEYAAAAKHLAYHLAAKGHEPELKSLLRLVTGGALVALAGAEVLQVALEHQLNRKLYADLRESLVLAGTKVLDRNVKKADELSPTQARLRKAILGITAQLQGSFNKPELKHSDDAEKAQGELLMHAYSILLRTGEESPKNVGTFHNNFAEAAFRLRLYDVAATHYLWLAKYSRSRDARTKAIASQFQLFKTKGLVPEKLTATLAPEPHVEEWLALVETAFSEEKTAVLADYVFEAQRIVYAQGKKAAAAKRLAELVQERFDFVNAVPAASLALDTYLAEGEWERARKLADALLGAKASRDPKFNARLVQVSQDALFKFLEASFAAGSHAVVVGAAKAVFGGGQADWGRHASAILTLAGNAALAQGDRVLAAQFFARISKADAGPEVRAVSLLTEASLAEERIDFSAAAENYRQYFALPAAVLQRNAQDLPQLRQKALTVAWFSGKVELLDDLLRSPQVCSADNARLCERFQAISQLSGSRLFRRAKALQAVSPENRLAWATAMLGSDSQQELEAALPEVAVGSTADPVLRYVVLAASSRLLPLALAKYRANYRRLSPVRLERGSINRRLSFVKSHEALLARFAESPWAKVRSLAQSEVGRAYAELVEDLRAIPPPKGVGPADVAVFRKSLVELTLPFEGKAMVAKETAPSPDPAAVTAALRTFEPKLFSGAGPKAVELRSAWARALSANNWPVLAFLIQDGKAKGYLPRELASAALGVALIRAGAPIEGLRELNEASPGRLPASARPRQEVSP